MDESTIKDLIKIAMEKLDISEKKATAGLLSFMCGFGSIEDFKDVTNYYIKNQYKWIRGIWELNLNKKCLNGGEFFPDDFIFFGSLSTQYKMIGNAVPPLMAYVLAKAIKKEIEEKKSHLPNLQKSLMDYIEEV